MPVWTPTEDDYIEDSGGYRIPTLVLIRDRFTSTSTGGQLMYGDQVVCFTLEDFDRGLDQTMSVEEIRSIKVYGQTAIPYGLYDLKWHESPRFGRVPHITGVKGFSYILIHGGNGVEHTSGCLLTGMVRDGDEVRDSQKALAKVKRLIIDNNIKQIQIIKAL